MRGNCASGMANTDMWDAAFVAVARRGWPAPVDGTVEVAPQTDLDASRIVTLRTGATRF